MADSGGTLFAGPPEGVFSPLKLPAGGIYPLWPWLIITASLLLPLDIAIRRLALEKKDFLRAWNRITRRTRGAALAPDPVSSSALTALKKSKARVRGSSHPAEKNPAMAARKPVDPSEMSKSEESGEGEGKKAPSGSASEPEHEISTTEALLAKKRTRRTPKPKD
jgi:hypothetical protein